MYCRLHFARQTGATPSWRRLSLPRPRGPTSCCRAGAWRCRISVQLVL